MWTYFHKWGSPKWFYSMSLRWMQVFFVLAALLITFGIYHGMFVAPADYQQGNSVRIMYIHVPSAFLSMSGYVMLAVCAFVAAVWKMKIAYAVNRAIAPIGALFTFLALFTGAVWGKPTWGTWWLWDARITSETILLFLYFGFMALHAAIDDRDTADKASGVLAMVGVINVPIIHYSVEWWNSLHQGSTLLNDSGPSLDGDMLVALLTMIVGTKFLFAGMVLYRTRTELLVRESRAKWVKEVIRHG
jgi:heme exporter protein C